MDFHVLDCEKEDCIGRRLRVRRDEMNALTQQISKSNTLSNAAVASKSGSGDAQEENLPILQSAAKQWKDKIVASALEVKSSVSENNISNENPEESMVISRSPTKMKKQCKKSSRDFAKKKRTRNLSFSTNRKLLSGCTLRLTDEGVSRYRFHSPEREHVIFRFSYRRY